MPPARYPWIDYLKALGIYLVVVGHTPLPVETHRWIYAFHMPLFFMISGFLVSPGGFDVSLREFFNRRVRKLVQLYFAFGIFCAAIYCFQFRSEQPLLQAVLGRLGSLAYATSSRNDSQDLYPLVLWFFPALITALLLVFAVWKISSAWGRAGAILLVFISGFLMTGLALPWEFESACVAAGFLALGHYARIFNWETRIAKMMPLIIVGSLLALWCDPSLDIRLAVFGNPMFSLAAFTLLVIGWAAAAMKLPPSRIVAAISAATILIFPLHTLAFPYIDRIAGKVPMLSHSITSEWFSWAKATVIVAGGALIHFTYGQCKARWLAGRATG